MCDSALVTRLFLFLSFFSISVSGCESPESTENDTEKGSIYPIATVPVQYETNVPLNKVIYIYFNDHLDASSIETESLLLRSGTISKWLMAFYDPRAKALVIWPSSNMRKNAVWELEIKEGLKGIDGSDIVPHVALTFTTGEETVSEDAYTGRTYTKDVKPIFDARCTSCHSGIFAAGYGRMNLSSEDGLRETVFNIAAEQWPIMNVVTPFYPGSSYLLYKIINDEYVAGKQMPRTIDDDSSATLLTDDEQRIISDWIVGGAVF